MALSAVSSAEDPVREARIDLAAAHRLAARLGFDDGIWNHFSLKLPGRPEHFLVKTHGLLCSEITASNLITVDADGNTIEGQGDAERSAVCIHSPIHIAKAETGRRHTKLCKLPLAHPLGPMMRHGMPNLMAHDHGQLVRIIKIGKRHLAIEITRDVHDAGINGHISARQAEGIRLV